MSEHKPISFTRSACNKATLCLLERGGATCKQVRPPTSPEASLLVLHLGQLGLAEHAMLVWLKCASGRGWHHSTQTQERAIRAEVRGRRDGARCVKAMTLGKVTAIATESLDSH